MTEAMLHEVSCSNRKSYIICDDEWNQLKAQIYIRHRDDQSKKPIECWECTSLVGLLTYIQSDYSVEAHPQVNE